MHDVLTTKQQTSFPAIQEMFWEELTKAKLLEGKQDSWSLSFTGDVKKQEAVVCFRLETGFQPVSCRDERQPEQDRWSLLSAAP